MYIIAGLGNPEKKYDNTMHNVGFSVVDLLVGELNITFNKKGFKGVFGEGSYGGEKIIILKPQTYMNLSGESVREIMTFYKVPVENLIVVYDDIDIPIGALRIRPSGSAGTHNGMRNIVKEINSTSFPRVRIGTKPVEMKGDLVSYVLSTIKKEDRDTFDDVFDRAVRGIMEIVKNGVESAMCKFNSK